MSLIIRLLAWVGLPSWVAPLLIVGLFTGALGGAYFKGRHDSAASCREKELLAVIAGMEKDRNIALAADKLDQQRMKELEDQAKQAEQEVNKYEQELRSRPDSCSLTPADIDRMRNDRGR